MKHASLLWQLLVRDIQTRYLGSISGLAWALLHPLILLAIYSFVFTVIFKARVPEADLTGFVPYLAMGFWPWMAFSEALSKATLAIEENKDLIAKVAIPRHLLVLIAVASPFILHVAGFAIVLIVMQLSGTNIVWHLLPLALLLLALLFAFAYGLGLIASSTQVFVRDTGQAMGPLLTFWFFATPIIYSVSLIPEQYRHFIALNPMTWFVVTMRELLLFDNPWAIFSSWVVPALVLFSLLAGFLVLPSFKPLF